MNADVWRGRRVLVTGHTGFKGSWLALWLHEAGARVTGFALPPATLPSSYTELAIERRIASRFGDVRDGDTVRQAFREARPEVVFHLAAQPIVRASYDDPVGTLSTNTMGTANVLDAARAVGIGAAVVVTTDKVYRNLGEPRAFREDDPLGGHDPYSASKACAELVTACYRDAYRLPIAAARAGNVIGGGDRSTDRIVPDVVRAWESGVRVLLRHPNATRPWQHVADALHGYVVLAEHLLQDPASVSDAYNFGPPPADERSVRELVEGLVAVLGPLVIEMGPQDEAKPEAPTLALDPQRAYRELGWSQRYDFGSAVRATARWYLAEAEGEDLAALTLRQLAGEPVVS